MSLSITSQLAAKVLLARYYQPVYRGSRHRRHEMCRYAAGRKASQQLTGVRVRNEMVKIEFWVFLINTIKTHYVIH